MVACSKMEVVLHPRSPTLAWIRSLGKLNLLGVEWAGYHLCLCGLKQEDNTCTSQFYLDLNANYSRGKPHHTSLRLSRK